MSRTAHKLNFVRTKLERTNEVKILPPAGSTSASTVRIKYWQLIWLLLQLNNCVAPPPISPFRPFLNNFQLLRSDDQKVEPRVGHTAVIQYRSIAAATMFFGGGDPFEHFGHQHGGGGRARRPAANVDTNKLYETLGVEKSADEKEVKKAYRKLA